MNIIVASDRHRDNKVTFSIVIQSNKKLLGGKSFVICKGSHLHFEVTYEDVAFWHEVLAAAQADAITQ